MTCQECSADIPRLAEGRLDEARRAEIDAHVATCSACRAAVDAQRDVARVLALRPEFVPPAAFAARVKAEVERARGWYGVFDWRWLAVRMAPVAGALLIAGVIVVERDATATVTTSSPASLSQVVESWAGGGGEGQSSPATSVLWQKDVTDDSMLLTVLASPADGTIRGQSDER